MRKASLTFNIISFMALVAVGASLLCMDILRVKNTDASVLGLPEPNILLETSKAYSLPILKGLRLDPQNPLNISFIVDSADKSNLTTAYSSILIKYFMTALAVPKESLWVNLSPYENDRILENSVSQTDLGRDLMAQDYVLKQLASSLTSPDTKTGKAYWSLSQKGDKFNKVWIVPDYVKVYEHENSAVIAESSLQVKSEQDYLAMQNNGLSSGQEPIGLKPLIDELNYQINESKHFAKTRQIFSAIILALWFKQKFADSFYKHYMDSNKVNGIDLGDLSFKEKIFELYLKSANKGVYDLIKTEKKDSKVDKVNYFSGGQNYVNTLSSAVIVADQGQFEQSVDVSNEENYIGDALIVEAQLFGSSNSSSIAVDMREMMRKGYVEFEQDGRSYIYANRLTHFKNGDYAGDNAYMFEIYDITDMNNEEVHENKRIRCVGFTHMGMKQVLYNNLDRSDKIKDALISFFFVVNNNDAYIHYRFPDNERLQATFSPKALMRFEELGVSQNKLVKSAEAMYRGTNNAIEVAEDYQGKRLGHLLYASALAYAKINKVDKFAIIDTGIADFFNGYINADRQYSVTKNFKHSYGPMVIRHSLKFSLSEEKQDVNWDKLQNSTFDLSINSNREKKADKIAQEINDQSIDVKNNKTSSSAVGGIDFKDTEIETAGSSISAELTKVPFTLENFSGFEFDINQIKTINSQEQMNVFISN